MANRTQANGRDQMGDNVFRKQKCIQIVINKHWYYLP